MKSINKFIRLIHIQFIIARYGLDQLVFALPAFSAIRFLSYLNPFNWYRSKSYSQGQALRLALQTLGPIFVKFGQALSTRRDLLPDDIADELALLQDQVPPFSGVLAKAMAEQALNAPLSQHFSYFDIEPLASASIAQVHAAQLLNGKEVVIKILRPDIKKIIKRDVGLLYSLANLIDKYWDRARRLRPVEIVKEFEKTLMAELDLQREAANAAQLRRNFTESALLYIPEVYWTYTRQNILTLERIYGIPISNIAVLKQRNVNFKNLAERGVEIFFTQVFRDNFFHADMHPGNIFVSTQDSENPQYIAVDFGIVGTLDEQDKYYLAENFYAFFTRDYHRVAKLHIEHGWAPPETRVVDLESAIRTLCEPMFERPLGEISLAKTLLQLIHVARQFNMEVQPQLVLLQKTMLTIEGLGRQLYPNLDLWNTAKPFLERWLRQERSPMRLLEDIYEEYPAWLKQLPQVPSLIYDVLTLRKKELTFYNQQMQMLLEAKSHKQYYGLWVGILSGILSSGALYFLYHNFIFK